MIIDAPWNLVEAARWKKRHEAAIGRTVGMLLVDLTDGMLHGARDLGDQPLNIEAFIQLVAKRNGIPVIEVVPPRELTTKSVADKIRGCKRIAKEGTDAFWCTDLEGHIKREGLGTLIVAGAYTGQCIASTVQSLVGRSLGLQFMSCPEILIAERSETNEAVQSPIWCRDAHVRYYRKLGR